MVLVRNVKQEDTNAIIELGSQIFREKDEIPLLQKALSSYIPELSFVAVEDESVVGFTFVCKSWTYVYHNFMTKIPNCYELAFLGISPKCQGRGLGTRLLKETLIAIFQTSTQFSCWLCVDTINKSAIKLYEKFGFRIWTETENTFMPCYIMGLSDRRYIRKQGLQPLQHPLSHQKYIRQPSSIIKCNTVNHGCINKPDICV